MYTLWEILLANNIENQTQCSIIPTNETAKKSEKIIQDYFYEEKIADVKIRVVNTTIDKFQYAEVITIGAI